jgi:hypothetical protein
LLPRDRPAPQVRPRSGGIIAECGHSQRRAIVNTVINKEEYEIIRNWYDEWVKAARLTGTVAFTAIAVTVPVFKISSDHPLLPEVSAWIHRAWILLCSSGMLAGAGIVLAYLWMDAVTKAFMPSLVGKVVLAGRSSFLRLATVGWAVTFFSLAILLGGLVCLVRAGLLVLGA